MMRDEISKKRIGLLHPSVRSEVKRGIDSVESNIPDTIKVRIVQGLRTIEEQNELYAQGRTKPGKIITNARGGKSYHNYGLAIDFAIMYKKDSGLFYELSWDINKDGDKDGKKDWDEVIGAFESMGWQSGGKWRTFKDYPHLQKTFGYTVAQLLYLYNQKHFILNTKYIKL